jgi:sulfoxide reductase heme-binding subunit YedZ
MKKIFLSRWTKVFLFVACLIPAAYLGWRAYRQDLGANPVEYITHFTGDWTLRFLLLTLTITPLRGLLNQPQLIRFRRMLGLFAFFYGTLHFTTWFCLDKWFDWNEMVKDIAKRPFITVGFTGFVLMIPLAVTSTAGWVRRLGYARWQRLHRLIYASAIAGVIHYYWLVKSDVRLPLMYAGILAILFAYRLAKRKRPARTVPAVQATS